MNHNYHEICNRQQGANGYAAVFQDAHGTIPYGMTNDYMFRAVLQANNKVLRGLICSLLHLSEKDVFSVKIANPVVMGENVEKKEIRLDINVVLNDHTLINLEMQVANQLNWKKRSVIYLCRSFDQLNRGQDYTEARPAVHIGFLDYTLFWECTEFYASYKLINVKNNNIYDDNLILNVVDLSRIDLASEDDKKYHIDRWAALFKATTWEEIRMLVSDNEYLNEAAETIFRMNADEQVRKQCRDREEYYQDLRSYERAIGERESVIEGYKREVEKRESAIEGYKKEVEKRESAIEGYKKEVEKRENTIEAYKKTVEEKDVLIQKLLDENAKLRSGK